MPTIRQRIVSISINKTASGFKCRYSYVSPVTGLKYQDAPVCDIQVKEPLYCLFVLDYETTAAGWTIEKISPAEGSDPINWVPGPYSLSIATADPYMDEEKTYNFYIYYCNKLNLPSFREDPQEGNGPP